MYYIHLSVGKRGMALIYLLDGLELDMCASIIFHAIGNVTFITYCTNDNKSAGQVPEHDAWTWTKKASPMPIPNLCHVFIANFVYFAIIIIYYWSPDPHPSAMDDRQGEQ